jgi:hypothetical protein
LENIFVEKLIFSTTKYTKLFTKDTERNTNAAKLRHP